MEDWTTFDITKVDIPIEWPEEERTGLSSDLVKRVLFVLLLCDKRGWQSVLLETDLKKGSVTLTWDDPYRRELCLYEDGSNTLISGYEPVSHPVEMTQLEETLIWHVSRQTSIINMRRQFYELLESNK